MTGVGGKCLRRRRPGRAVAKRSDKHEPPPQLCVRSAGIVYQRAVPINTTSESNKKMAAIGAGAHISQLIR